MPPALRRLRALLRLRDLLARPRPLPGRRPSHRAPHRHPARSPRHRLHRPPRRPRPRTRPLTPEELPGPPTKLSHRSVTDTVAEFTSMIGAKGIRLFAVIDQRAEARQAGLDLRDTTLVIF